MTSKRRFFSGDSLAHALNQAAQHFQLLPGEIDYKTVEKRHGFLKVRRKVVIEVDELSPKRGESGVAPISTSVEPTATSADREPAVEPADAAPEPKADRSTGSTWSFEVGTDDSSSVGRFDEPEADSEEGSAELPTESWTPSEMAAAVSLDPEPAEERGMQPAEVSAEAPVDEPVDEPADETVDEPPVRLEESEASRESEGSADESDNRPPRRRRSRRRRRGRGGSKAGTRVELAEAPVPAGAKFSKATGEEAEAASKALDSILSLADLVVESEILQGDEHLQIELRGADQDLLLRDRGRLLLAIQHLLPRVVRGLIGRSVVCKVDSDNYHDIREERLRDMAQRAADEVRHGGRPKTLEPMSPDERRIVHLTLADYPGVETESHGSGLFKRVMVRTSAGERSAGSDSYRR